MNDAIDSAPSADDRDDLNFPRPEEQEFDRVVQRAISRRGFLRDAMVFGSGAALMGATGVLTPSVAQAQQTSRFAFSPIPTATDGNVHVPEGYSWQALVRWGDALFSDAEENFDHATGGSTATSDRVFGENTDGMELFLIDGRQILAVNHEYTNPVTNLPQATDGVPRSAEDVRKLQNLQGVSIFEIAEGEEGWQVVVDSPFNRRITHNTPMRLSGPAAGHELMKTQRRPGRDREPGHHEQLRRGQDALGNLPDL